MSPRALLSALGVAALLMLAYCAGRAGAPRAADDPVPAPAAREDARPSAGQPPPGSAIRIGGMLPAVGAPLRDTLPALQARARAGDLAAASRLVRDLDRCARLRGAQWRASRRDDALVRKDTSDMSAAQLRTYQVLLDAAERHRQAMDDDRATCAGVDDAMLEALVPTVARAGGLGDASARACYLARGPLLDPRGLLAHPEWLRTYRGNAQTMVEAGLAEGDWRVVDLLRHAYAPGAQGVLAGMLGADPVQHYRYLALYRLGAEPHRAADLDRQLDAAAAVLAPTQQASADAWVRRTLEASFGGARSVPSTGATPEGWEACAF